MSRETLKLHVIKDTCLGYIVFRGSALASQLLKASWIDFHDPDLNEFGYQRPFDEKRSQKAAGYASQVDRAFWPESIFAIRTNDEVYNPFEEVHWSFIPADEDDARYGVLEVNYNADGVTQIYAGTYPWRRAFSQVDCQHRLGKMADSDKLVTFCLFTDLPRREESLIFRTINANQRKISTSLVDSIIMLTDPNAAPQWRWAWNLDSDVGSPYHRRVDTGGRGRPSKSFFITLAGLRQSIEILIPATSRRDDANSGDVYLFIRNFWTALNELWPTEFVDKEKWRLQRNSSQRALARFGKLIFQKLEPVQDYSITSIQSCFNNDPSRIDWSLDGPFQFATGKGGDRQVYAELVAKYGIPG